MEGFMIFDKDYDASLWFILKSDAKNRKEIVEFIKEIPEELLEKIKESINKAKKEEFDFQDEFLDYYSCQSKNDPHISFYFQLDEDNALTLIKSHTDENTKEDLFELVLFPINKDFVKMLDFFEGEWLGTITNNIKTNRIDEKVGLIECDENEYNIYNTPIGNFISYSRRIFDGKYAFSIYKPVSLRRVPEDIEKTKIFRKTMKV
jgi:hypothetical protein